MCPAVSGSAFCLGVERTDQRKDLPGNPSEAKELPERPPMYRIKRLTKVHVCPQIRVGGTSFDAPSAPEEPGFDKLLTFQRQSRTAPPPAFSKSPGIPHTSAALPDFMPPNACSVSEIIGGTGVDGGSAVREGSSLTCRSESLVAECPVDLQSTRQTSAKPRLPPGLSRS